MQTISPRVACPVERVTVRAYRIPTEGPESDGTLEWDATTMTYVEVAAAGEVGIGYTYGDAACATLVRSTLASVLEGKDALQTAALHGTLAAKVRNDGITGIASMAISAVDVALWDLKGKILRAPVCTLLGTARERVPLYGSGGFTSYAPGQLLEHMTAWVHESGIPRVKMKIGRDPEADPKRVASVRRAIGRDAELYVDANGACSVKQALSLAERFACEDVSWFEEPVYHRDLAGNAAVARSAPSSMEISNGEYGYALDEFASMLDAGAADVLQADVTRCGGITGFMAVDALCDARSVPLSSHCAPAATLHAAAAAKRLRHVEYFFDHVRIERMFFDGAPEPDGGAAACDTTRPGIGLELKRQDAERYAL